MRSFGQSIDRMVVAPAGEDFHTSDGSLVFTIGELNIETFTKDIQLSQGFHQEWVVITSLEYSPDETLKVKVYPNPTPGILNIESDATLQIQIFDLTGKLKFKSSMPPGHEQIHIDQFPSGMYVLEFTDNDGKRNAMKIEKLE